MPVAEGTISKLHFKPLDQEDDYGNFFRASFKIEGDDNWYGCGGKKSEAIAIKNGKDWHDLQEGDEIEFSYTLNGNYRNVKSSKITLVAAGGGGRAAAPAQRPAAKSGAAPAAGRAAAPASGGGKARSINPEYAVGRWVNGAVSLVQAGRAANLKEGILLCASIEQWATTHFDRILTEAKGIDPTGGEAKAAVPAPARKAPPPPPPDDGGDDDPPEQEAPPPPPKPAARRRAAPAPAARQAPPPDLPPGDTAPDAGPDDWQDDDIPF